MKKEQVWEFVKKWYKDAAALVFITLAVTVLVVHFLGLRGQDLTYPLEYKGGDEMSALVSVRLVQESGWNIGTDKLTALDGYYYNTSDVIAGLHNADVFFEKLFLWITGGQVAKTVNLVYLSAFYMIAYVAYFVLRQLRIKEWLSIGGALVYAFLPFIFIRGIGHIVLSCYYFVPLAVLMCIWLYEDERFMLPGKGFFKYKRNYAGFIMAFLIASEGIGYWQIFACFFLNGGNAYGTAPHERLELFEARLYQYPQCDCMRCDFHYPGNFLQDCTWWNRTGRQNPQYCRF